MYSPTDTKKGLRVYRIYGTLPAAEVIISLRAGDAASDWFRGMEARRQTRHKYKSQFNQGEATRNLSPRQPPGLHPV